MYELRFRGELLGFHPDEGSAHDHLSKHYKEHFLSGMEDDFTVTPRRAHSLYCRGSLVDTFDSSADAEKHAAALVKKSVERPIRGVAPLTEGDFAVTSGSPPPVPAVR